MKNVVLGLIIVLFIAANAHAESLVWGKKPGDTQLSKPGKPTSLYDETQSRKVKGQLGRGSQYMSHMNPTPLQFFNTQDEFETQY